MPCPGASPAGRPVAVAAAAGGLARGCRGGSPKGSALGSGSVGSSTLKVAPPPGVSLSSDSPAVGVGDGCHDREPETGTTLGTDPGRVRAPEAFEHVGGGIRRDPGAVVDHEDLGPGTDAGAR